MTDLDKLKEVLDNQAERGIKSGDWDRLTYAVKREDSNLFLSLDGLKVVFKFTQRGRLLGAYNWKE